MKSVLPARRWLRLVIAYDGTHYAGWQWQPTEPTVQAAVEQAWQKITGEEVNLTASGRTDAGVHALGQVAAVRTSSTLSCDRLRQGLNAVLPDDVVVRAIVEVAAGFHATHDALCKTYRYQLQGGRVRPLFDRGRCWHIPQTLDVGAMNDGAGHLVGRHDFASFETSGSERGSTVRTITRCEVIEHPHERLDIEVTGDGFLYNMVRSIAGTLVNVGRGTRPAEWVAEVLAARDRRAAGQTAPAQGLFLLRVDYD